MADSDRTRSIAVVVTAVAQIVSAALTPVLLGDQADTGVISDANRSPVTPAGYAFSIWGLIYLGSLVLAGYQALRTQREREVHRRTGWWLVGAFTAATVWVPIFGTRTLWLAQVVILVLVGCLAMAARHLRGQEPAPRERLAFRLPITLYLGWVTVATAAGFGTTFRSLGLPERGGWTTLVSVLLVVAAAVASVVAVGRLVAVVGFALSACWALVALVVATYSGPVRITAVVALVLILAVLGLRTARSRQPRTVLLG